MFAYIKTQKLSIPGGAVLGKVAIAPAGFSFYVDYAVIEGELIFDGFEELNLDRDLQKAINSEVGGKWSPLCKMQRYRMDNHDLDLSVACDVDLKPILSIARLTPFRKSSAFYKIMNDSPLNYDDYRAIYDFAQSKLDLVGVDFDTICKIGDVFAVFQNNNIPKRTTRFNLFGEEQMFTQCLDCGKYSLDKEFCEHCGCERKPPSDIEY